MAEETKGRRAAPAGLDAQMRTVSQAVSTAALTLMIVGFAAATLNGPTAKGLDEPVVPLGQLVRSAAGSWPFAAMSVGIALLALLPSARVLLAAWAYLRQRNLTDVIVALLVLAELILSATLGR